MATAGSPQAAIRSQQPTQGGQTPGQARPPVTAAPATASGQTSLEDSKINLKLIRGHAIKELTEILMMVCLGLLLYNSACLTHRFTNHVN